MNTIRAVIQSDTPLIKQYADLAAFSKMEWCGRHRVDFRRYTYDQMTDPAIHPAWQKIRSLIREVCRYMEVDGWIWQTDADYFVTDMTLAGKEALDGLLDNSGVDVIIGEDERGINSGSWLLRACPENLDLLESVWEDRYDPDHSYAEQDGLKKYLEHSKALVLPHRHPFNLYPPEWKPGSLGIHLPGHYEPQRYRVDELYLTHTVR
jgi:hypothetical protein